MLLAEIASYQLEYKYLAHLTGKENYFQVVSIYLCNPASSDPNFDL
jgi:hypothetical protein